MATELTKDEIWLKERDEYLEYCNKFDKRPTKRVDENNEKKLVYWSEKQKKNADELKEWQVHSLDIIECWSWGRDFEWKINIKNIIEYRNKNDGNIPKRTRKSKLTENDIKNNKLAVWIDNVKSRQYDKNKLDDIKKKEFYKVCINSEWE